jgi:hypothetical protein
MKQFWIKLHKETTEDSLLKLEMAKWEGVRENRAVIECNIIRLNIILK